MNELNVDSNSLRDGFVGKGYKRGAVVGVKAWRILGAATRMEVVGVKKESKVVGLVEGQ